MKEVKLQKYPVYKDSGVEWLGEIPEHWEVKKITHIFNTIGSGTTPTAGAAKYYNDGTINFLQTGDLTDGLIRTTSKRITNKAISDFSSLKTYPKESLVIAMYGATIGKVGYLDIDTTTNQACCVLGIPNNFFTKYGFYWFIGAKSTIISMSYGGGQPNISQDLIKSLRVSVPPLLEQTAIANFLDNKTALLDNAIALKEKQIVLLEEKKKIIINKSVTKGINNNVKFKDSNVKWLGLIPEHWLVVRSKWLFQQRKERSRKEDIQLTASQKHGVIYQKDYMELEGRRVTQVEFNNDILKHVETNDFVISMRSFQGGIEFCPFSGCVSSAYVALIPSENIDLSYFKYLFKSDAYIKALSSTSNLVRDGQALRFDNFSQVDLLLIPKLEQHAIAEYIENITSKISTAISLKEKEIEKLKEYKSVLINEAVSGKIKVG